MRWKDFIKKLLTQLGYVNIKNTFVPEWMTKDEIITEVTGNEEYKRICRKMLGGKSLYKDLYHELILILLEKPQDYFNNIPNITQAKYFIVGILCKMVHGKRSTFRKLYASGDELKEVELTEGDEIPDERINAIEKAFEKESWFEKELLNIYLKEGSYQGVEDTTKISKSFAYRTITKLKDRVKNKMKRVNVLLVAQRRDDALKFHRQISPHTRLLKTHADEITISVKATNDGEKESHVDDMTDEHLKQFDIVYYLRQISYRGGNEKDTIDRLRSLGLKVVLDIDDNWKLSSDHRMYQAHQRTRKSTEFTLGYVDHVVTTTEFFADEIRKLNPNVTVLPNCINPDDTQFRPEDISGPRMRFGWIGGVYHRQDIESMDDTFCRVYKDKQIRDSVQICLGGYNYPNDEYQAIEKTMTCNYDWRYTDATYMEYLNKQVAVADHYTWDKPYRRLYSLDVHNYGTLYNQINVALIPLRADKFNGCKSELKIVEAGWMGKAVIVSDVMPYSKWIKHGVNGLKVNNKNPIEWYFNIKKLAQNPNMVKDLGAALQETIKENFDMDKHNERRLQLYKSLI